MLKNIRGTRFRIWPLLPQPEIPGYLELMERKGLRFERLRCCGQIGQFTKTEPAEVRYDWDYFFTEKPGVPPEDELLAYQDFYEDTGWEIVWQMERSKIFREIPGREPIQMHTDEEIWKEKAKRYAKKFELYQGIWQAIIAAFIGFWVWDFFIGEFPIQTMNMEKTVITLAVMLVCMPIYFLYNGIRYVRGRRTIEQTHEMSDRKVKLGSALTLLMILAVITVLYYPIAEYGETAALAGLAIGWPIGSAIRRNYMGQGGAARKKGIKGIPNYSWKTTLFSILLAACLIVVSFVPAFDGLRERGAQQTNNLYCKILYRESPDWPEASYYLANSNTAAKKIRNAYINEKISEWENSWRQIAPDSLPELPAVGPYPIPDKAEITKAYWKPDTFDETEKSGDFLVMQGLQIWYVYKEREGGYIEDELYEVEEEGGIYNDDNDGADNEGTEYELTDSADTKESVNKVIETVK